MVKIISISKRQTIKEKNHGAQHDPCTAANYSNMAYKLLSLHIYSMCHFNLWSAFYVEPQGKEYISITKGTITIFSNFWCPKSCKQKKKKWQSDPWKSLATNWARPVNIGRRQRFHHCRWLAGQRWIRFSSSLSSFMFWTNSASRLNITFSFP